MIGDHPFAKKIPPRRPELPFVWNVSTPQELSNQIRQHWPAKNPETREFKSDGLAAYALLTDAKWKGQVEADLEWEHRDGTTHKSVLSGLSRGTLSFKSGTGPREVSLRLISNDSAVKVFEIFRPKLKGLSVQERVDAKETESFRRVNMSDNALGMGVEGFQRDFGCLPPRAIVDENGKPLLSWRVTFLPYLGYEDLFSLFHLDEPWDSKHNAKLIPFMPPIYGGTQVKETDSGKATIQGIVADNAWFPDQGLRFNPDFIQPYRYTISHVETKPEHAVVWTAPEDVRLDDPDLMTKIMVSVEEGGFLNGKRQPDKRFFHAIAGEGTC